LQGSATGNAVYTETHSATTDGYGLINLEIGKGTVTLGTFSGINWGTSTYFIKVSVDGVEMGTSQLLSVPYALYAKTAANGFSGSYSDLLNKPTLFNGTWTSLTGQPTTIVGYGITDFDFTGAAANDLLKFDGTKWIKFTPNYLTSISVPNQTAGDLMYFDGTNWVRVPKGTIGQILTISPSNVPYWQNGSAFSSPIPPTSTALAATNVLLNSATINGSVNANGFITTVSTEYGLTTSYGSIIMEADGSPVSGNTDKNVSSDISSLSANTEYHFRLKTSNAVGVTYSNDMTFTTLGAAPTISTTVSSGTTNSGATLNGTINANGFSSTVTFEYGLTTVYGSLTNAIQSPVTGNSNSNVSARLTGLASGTIYHYRVKAVNSVGTTYGSDVTFTTPSPINDVDGNTYNVVAIGAQVWMAENLKSTKYNDGTPIPNITVDATWAALATGAYSDYNNTSSNSTTYGRLYNWYTVDNNSATKAASNGGKNVCPTGWHVPSSDEWTTLTDYLTNNGYGYGGIGILIAKSMASISGWNTDPTAGNVGNDQASNNSSGFAAVPSGFRNSSGLYSGIGSNALWWGSTANSSVSATNRTISYDYNDVFRYAINIKQSGFSVRCLKD
jgi:uncharacterized protein (TIGR02145 family)